MANGGYQMPQSRVGELLLRNWVNKGQLENDRARIGDLMNRTSILGEQQKIAARYAKLQEDVTAQNLKRSQQDAERIDVALSSLSGGLPLTPPQQPGPVSPQGGGLPNIAIPGAPGAQQQPPQATGPNYGLGMQMPVDYARAKAAGLLPGSLYESPDPARRSDAVYAGVGMQGYGIDAQERTARYGVDANLEIEGNRMVHAWATLDQIDKQYFNTMFVESQRENPYLAGAGEDMMLYLEKDRPGQKGISFYDQLRLYTKSPFTYFGAVFTRVPPGLTWENNAAEIRLAHGKGMTEAAKVELGWFEAETKRGRLQHDVVSKVMGFDADQSELYRKQMDTDGQFIQYMAKSIEAAEGYPEIQTMLGDAMHDALNGYRGLDNFRTNRELPPYMMGGRWTGPGETDRYLITDEELLAAKETGADVGPDARGRALAKAYASGPQGRQRSYGRILEMLYNRPPAGGGSAQPQAPQAPQAQPGQNFTPHPNPNFLAPPMLHPSMQIGLLDDPSKGKLFGHPTVPAGGRSDMRGIVEGGGVNEQVAAIMGDGPMTVDKARALQRLAASQGGPPPINPAPGVSYGTPSAAVPGVAVPTLGGTVPQVTAAMRALMGIVSGGSAPGDRTRYSTPWGQYDALQGQPQR